MIITATCDLRRPSSSAPAAGAFKEPNRKRNAREAQFDIVERMYSSIGQAWGYRKGEKVEPPGKYETDKFRCARCNLYDVPVPEKTLPVDAEFPECEQCAKIKKPAQWYRLTLFKSVVVVPQ